MSNKLIAAGGTLFLIGFMLGIYLVIHLFLAQVEEDRIAVFASMAVLSGVVLAIAGAVLEGRVAK